MEIQEYDTDNVHVVKLSGDFTSAEKTVFQKTMNRCAAAHSKVVLDIADLVYMRATVMHVLTRASDALRENGGALAIACLQPNSRIVFHLTGALYRLPVYSTLAEAIHAISHPKA